MLALPRARWLLLLAAIVALAVAGGVYRPWIEAQARAVAVLATTLETPVLSGAVDRLTDEPRIDDLRVAGVPATLARPPGDGSWPALVFVNGATELGRREPMVARLAEGLARAGYLVVVPDPPGLRAGIIGDRAVEATTAVGLATARRPGARAGRVGFVGVSIGATLALVAAAEPQLRDRVTVVAGIAAFTDLREAVRLATTGYHRDPARPRLLVRQDAEPFLRVVVARSLAASLPPGSDRALVAAELERLDEEDPDLAAALRDVPADAVGPETRSVLRLLRNDDPRRFDALYAELPPELRATLERLSPVNVVERIEAPVELVSGPQDAYGIPTAQSEELAQAAPNVRVTVTSVFAHAVPEPSLTDPKGLALFDGWVVRSLHAAAGRG